MKLKVKNLGPIESAEIDLNSPFIVLSGQNNTGKTYLTTLIYSLYSINYNLPEYTLTKIEDSYSADGELTKELNIKDFFVNNMEFIEFSVEEAVKKQLSKTFSSPTENFTETEIEITLSASSILRARREHLYYAERVYDNDGLNYDITIKREKGSSELRFTLVDEGSDLGFLEDEFIPTIALKHCFELLFGKTIFFPAERQGITLFHKEIELQRLGLFESMIAINSEDSLKKLMEFSRNRINRYSKPIIDYLSFLNEMTLPYNKGGGSIDIDVKDFENSIYDGEVILSSKGNLKFKTKEREFDINVVSSTVKSLMGLNYYLKKHAKRGDFLIIDEPELNLHPDNQITIIRFIAKLVNYGLKIIISTHSEYILRELNNLMILNGILETNIEAANTFLEKYKYEKSMAMPRANVSAYLLMKNGPVEKIEIGEYGLTISTIDDTSEKLDDTTHELMFIMD